MATTTNYSLTKPVVGSEGWGEDVNTNFDTIDTRLKADADAAAAAQSTATAALPKTGGNITGNLNVSGKVGVGTTSPREQLEIKTTEGISADLLLSEADTYGWRLRNNQGGNALSVDGTTDFDTYSIKLAITTGGNVGIGTSSPSEKLDVVGNVEISGHIVGTDGTSNPTNLLANGDFESWSAGASDAPDGMTLVGGAVARESGASNVKRGTYSAKITTAGTAGGLLFDLANSPGSGGLEYWKGRTVTISGWIKTSTAGVATFLIYDGVSYSTPVYHNGDGTYQRISSTLTVSNSPTQLNVYPAYVSDSSATVYFDAVSIVEGSSAFAFSPKPLDASAQIIADTDETQFSHKLPVVINGTTYYIMMITANEPS